MNPHFPIDLSISDSLKIVRKSVLIYETIILSRLRELKHNSLVESAERRGMKQRIKEMREFLEQQSTEVTVYDERFEVEFKSGAKVDVER